MHGHLKQLSNAVYSKRRDTSSHTRWSTLTFPSLSRNLKKVSSSCKHSDGQISNLESLDFKAFKVSSRCTGTSGTSGKSYWGWFHSPSILSPSSYGQTSSCLPKLLKVDWTNRIRSLWEFYWLQAFTSNSLKSSNSVTWRKSGTTLTLPSWLTRLELDSSFGMQSWQ